MCLNSLTAISVLAGEKLVLFGRYVGNFHVGIVQYGLPKKKTRRAKMYRTTQLTNGEFLTSAKNVRQTLVVRHRSEELPKNRKVPCESLGSCAFNALSNSVNR
jgi:hypothetical protein